MKRNLLILALVIYVTNGFAQKINDTKYAALAVDTKNGFYYGFSYDYASLSDAEAKALQECKNKGGNCQVVVAVSGKACIAYRTIESKVDTAFGWGIAPTKDAADIIAKEECLNRSNGVVPNNFVWACNIGKAPLKVLKNQQISLNKKTRLTDENGDEYDFEGSLLNNKPAGVGIAHYVKSGKILKGTFLNGQIKGNGEAIFKSGDYYVGGFSDGKFNGYGSYSFKSGSKYEGNFVDGKEQGKGKFTEAEGSYYEGDYYNNLMHGYGKYIDPSG